MRGCEEEAEVRPIDEQKKTCLVQKVEEEREVWLDRFLDEARTEAAGTYPDVFGRTVDQGLDGLKIGIEDPLGLVIGMTDVVPRLTPFVADLTRECHG
jgi:hypothetical protein